MSSPDNSTVPPLTEIVDSWGQVWTIEPVTDNILLNGIQADGGIGSIILWVNQHIYVLGTNSHWFLWNIATSDFTDVGQQRPGPIPVDLQVVRIDWNELQNYLNLHENRVKFILYNTNIGNEPIPNKLLLVVDLA
jgi:hypothetical protein